MTRPGAQVLEDGRCRFRVWAPHRRRVDVCLLGESPRTVSLEKDRDGTWQATVEAAAGCRYVYRLDGELERPDPASGYQPEGVHAPSEVVDHRAFAWGDDKGAGVALKDMMIYELHVGTFTPEGTFDAAIARLTDLAALGINAVELMPVAQFPGRRNWGYDGVYPYAVQNSYGGPEALKRFVRRCHEHGLAVILDVVYNHLGPEGNYLRDFGPYFTGKYSTPWGESINFDDAYSYGVREFFIENALYWFEEYHLDALRLDALHAIVDLSAKHFIAELTQAVHRRSRRRGRSMLLIGESDLNDVRLIKPRRSGGCGLDAQWSDDFHHSLHALVTGERNGYYRDFGRLHDLAKALKEGFVYDWRYSEHRKRRHGSSSRHRPAEQFVVCIQNHDQVGNRMRGERLGHLVGFEALKLAAGALLLSPYVPLLFMGEEYAEPAPFQYFVDHGDPELVEAVRRGRAEEFKAFAWEGACPDPQAEETFRRCILDWERRTDGRHRRLWEFYRHLIHLRRSYPAFVDKSGLSVRTRDDKRILLWHRWIGRRQLQCLMNFSAEPQPFHMMAPDTIWIKLVDSAALRWDGPGETLPGRVEGECEVTMPPHSIALFEPRADQPLMEATATAAVETVHPL